MSTYLAMVDLIQLGVTHDHVIVLSTKSYHLYFVVLTVGTQLGLGEEMAK